MKFLFVFIFLFPIVLFGQTTTLNQIKESYQNKEVDNTFILEINKKTLAIKQQGKFKDALLLNDWLLEKINEKDNFQQYAPALHMRSRVEIDLGNYNNAILSAKKASTLYKKQKDTLNYAATNNIIGVGFYFKSNLDSTLHYYNKSYSIKKELKLDPVQLAISTYNIGIVYEDLALYDQAIEYYLKAVDFQTQDISDTNFLPDIYLAIANTYNNKNDLVKTQEFAALALQEGLKKYGPENPEISFVYESNGSFYASVEDYQNAKEFHKKALYLRNKYYGDTHKWTLHSYNDLAEIYLKTNQLDSALWTNQKALKIALKLNNNLDVAETYNLQAEILIASKKHSKSFNAIHKSQKLYTSVFNKNHKTIAKTYLQEATSYFNLNDTIAALQSVKKALESANYNPASLKSLTTPFIALEALELQFKLTKSKITSIDQLIPLIQHIQTFYQSNEAKLFFNKTTTPIIKNAFEFCYEQYQLTKSPLYLEKAFELVQLNVNSILAEELQSIKKDNSSPNAKTAYKKVQEFRQQWSQIRQQLYYEETANSPSKKIIDSLIKKRVGVSQLLDQAIKEHQKIANKNSNLKIISLQKIQEQLKQNEQVLHYFNTNNYMYVFSITLEEIQLQKLSETKKTTQDVELLRNAITNRTSLSLHSKRIYQKIISNVVQKSKDHLIIIPSEVLATIPFEVLQKNDTHYLQNNHTISYQSAISLMTNTETKTFQNNWTGFGIAYDSIQQLSNGITEIQAIQKITNGKRFLNKNVTSETIFDQAKKSEILHLAMHGTIDLKNPLYSTLDLNKSKITASQIYNENIRSNFIVLSACDTGSGSIEKGEGVMSLSRAFIFSGAKSTLTSLWKVPDKETAMIMTSFYTYLKAGNNKAKALQLAKKEYLTTTNDALLKHPYYWSGFIISGDTSMIQSNSTFFRKMIIFALLLLILMFFIFRFYRSEN